MSPIEKQALKDLLGEDIIFMIGRIGASRGRDRNLNGQKLDLTLLAGLMLSEKPSFSVEEWEIMGCEVVIIPRMKMKIPYKVGDLSNVAYALNDAVPLDHEFEDDED